ncbi:MAG: galactosyltransferase-related protein [Pseudomonadota bacterium]
MTKPDLSDTTILLSLKADSAARLENLTRLHAYYTAMTDGAELIVVQQGQAALPDLPGVHVHRLADRGLHWKTRNLNLAAALSNRPFLLSTDIDMVPKPAALADAMALLRSGADFCHLFDGLVLNISTERAAEFTDWQSFMAGLPHVPRGQVIPGDSRAGQGLRVLYGDANHRATGGGFVCRRAAFVAVGGYNENFVSYGAEDEEFDLRARRLGYDFGQVDGHNLYHFDHPRGAESRFGPFYRQNMAELARVEAMDRAALEAYVARRFRTLPFEPGYIYDRQSMRDQDLWQRRPDLRHDLSHLTLLVIADPARVQPSSSCLDALIDHVEATYRNCDIRICEPHSNAYKFPANRSDVVHHVLADGVTVEALRRLRQEAGRSELLVTRLGRDAERQFDWLINKLAERATDHAPPALPARPIPDGGNAIYLRFDDSFRDYACACLASMAQNYPDHPPLLVDYLGQDAELHARLRRLNAVLLPADDAPEFTRHLFRDRDRDAVIARFRLWRSALRGLDTIMHLDADTLVLAPLDDLFDHHTPYIVANHERSDAVRIFSQEHRWSPELHRLLREDGLRYPDRADDMGNAGLFTLPRAWRSRTHLARLAYLAARYGRFMAYADQSLLSLWLMGDGIQPLRRFADNFQTPFFTEDDVDIDFDDIRILHFSSPRKPGTKEFDDWHRVGPDRDRINALFAQYRAAPI